MRSASTASSATSLSGGGRLKGGMSVLKSKSASHLPAYSVSVVKVPLIPLTEPWQLEYAKDEEHVGFPLKLMFHDYLLQHACQIVDLKGWILAHKMFMVMRDRCQDMRSLLLDNTRGLTFDCMDAIRGHKQLRHLSLNKVDCVITKAIAQAIGSFKNLRTLGLNDCHVSAEVFVTLSQTAAQVRELTLARSKGLTSSALHAIGQWIARFRKLCKLDLTQCLEIDSDGVLDMMHAGYSTLQEVRLGKCTQLDTTALVALRSKMASLRSLDLSHMSLGNTVYEWLTEGCIHITHLNLSHSRELYDEGLVRIGRTCFHLEALNISNCMELTNQGISNFCGVFYGHLQTLDISGCALLGAPTAEALASKAHHLQSLKLNGLAKMTAPALAVLWAALGELRHFEMCSNLSTTSTHRRSSMPHFSDTVLGKTPTPCAATLTTLLLVGAFQITDAGMCKLVRECANLRHIDVSYCHGISDLLLLSMAQHSQHLHTFVGTGCMGITSAGLIALSQGVSALTLTRLELNGCSKVMDPGAVAIASLKNLEILGIRGCDHITDTPAIQIARSCTQLKTLDLLNLDYLSREAVAAFARHCPLLTTMNCEGCALTAKEFAHAVGRLPFATAVTNKSRLEALPQCVLRYNSHVRTVRMHDRYIRTIQKFRHFIQDTYVFRLAAKMQRKRMLTKARYFRVLRDTLRKEAKMNLREKRQDGAYELQYLVRRLYAVRLARLHARTLRRHRDARGLLQRLWRGHASRKRTKIISTRLYHFYSKIGHLVHKYLVIKGARVNHRRILAVQGFARMVPHRHSFKVLKWAVHCLQCKSRYWVFTVGTQKRAEMAAAELRRLEEVRRNSAARVMQKNWKNSFFNKSMSGFILTCCIYFRIDYDERLWSSVVVQRYMRGCLVRLRIWRKKMRADRSYVSATAIQSMARMFSRRKRYLPWRVKMRRVLGAWRRLSVKRPRLRLGRAARTMQRYGHRFLFMLRRHYAVDDIQRIFRGYIHRLRCRDMVLAMHVDKADKIKHAFHVYKCRRARKLQLAREHMAAFKLWQRIERVFAPRRLKAKESADKIKAYEDLQVRKVALLLSKRTRIVARIRDRYQNVMALRIQHAFQKYKNNKLLKASIPGMQKKSLKDMGRVGKSAVAMAAGAPLRVARKMLLGMGHPLGSTELIAEKDKEKLSNSVLKYQVKTILQEGLVGIHLTLGDLEAKIFQHHQTQYEKGHLSFFKKLPQDLSGELQLRVFLWLEMGTGKGCICQLEVAEKPTSMSTAGLKARAMQRFKDGVKIAWHQHIHFEIRGECSVMQGKADFAIQDVRVSTNDEEEASIVAAGGYTLSADLARLGMHTQLWSTARRPIDEDNLYRFVTLAAQPWFDDRLLRIAKGFNLSEADVLQMRDTFEEIQGAGVGEKVRASQVFEYLVCPLTALAEWIFEAIRPASPREVSFSEYVHMVAYFVMLGQKELMKFVFQACDTDNRQFLTEEQFCKMVAILGEDGPFNYKGWQKQYVNYYDRKLGSFFIGNFEQFLHMNPGVLWLVYDLQQKLAQRNLGKAYWAKKMEQFRITRLELGIKLV